MFKIFRRSVPAALCAAAVLTLIACEKADNSTGAQAEAVAAAKPPAEEVAKGPAEVKPAGESTVPEEVKEKTRPPAAVEPADLVAAGGPEAPPAKPSQSQASTATTPPTSDPRIAKPSRSGITGDQKRSLSIAKQPSASISRDDAASDRATTDVRNASRVVDPSFDRNAPPPDPSDLFVTVEPDKMEMGEIATGDTGIGSVKLTNNGEVEVRPKARSNCGCTTTGLRKGTILEPGESIDIQIRLRAGQTPRKLNKTVTFTFDPKGVHPPIRVPVRGDAKSFVTITPSSIDPDQNPEGKFILKSVDDQPFRITSMVPGLVTEFPEEARTEYEVTFSWDRWEELGSSRKLMFYTDHPRCARIIGSVVLRRRAATGTEPRRIQGPKPIDVRQPPEPRERPERPEPPKPPTVFKDLIEAGKASEIITRIKRGESPEARDGSGIPLLGLAAEYGELELMQVLIDAGADLDAVDTRAGLTPIMQAAQGNQVEAIRLLLNAGASLEARNKIGGTALSWAAGFGKAEAVQELIDQGAQVKVVGAVTGYTPLIWAAGFGDPRSIPILLDAGANIEATGLFQGATPLIYAARTGKPEGLKTLIERGASLESKQLDGQTAFLAACGGSGGTAEKVQLLLDAGADIHAKDNQGLGALELVGRRTDLNSDAVRELLERVFAEADKDKKE